MHKVLLILGSEDLRRALQEALRDNYEVIIGIDAEAGGELLRHRPDALILDLLLPGMDGLTFLRHHLNDRPPVVIMITTFLDSDVLQAMYDLGIDYAVRIPCPISAVVDQLDRLLK